MPNLRIDLGELTVKAMILGAGAGAGVRVCRGGWARGLGLGIRR